LALSLDFQMDIPMALPTVAIVIPTRYRHQMLQRCLSRLVPYVRNHPECSITVSDDGDAAETREALAGESAFVQVVQGPRLGPAANRNCGAAHATGELLVFLDDDCIPDPDLIAAYREAAVKNPQTGVFEGRITATGPASGFADAFIENEVGGYLWSCNFAIRRTLFDEVGGFDARFPFAAVEDVDLHFRVKRRSGIPFIPEARVWHDPERRHGWRIVKHHTLSLLLFLHTHGLESTQRGPVFFARMAVQTFLFRGVKYLRAGTAKDPEQLIYQCWANLQLAMILSIWRFHAPLAKRLYPPCCPGCERIHSALAGDGHPGSPHPA
jgi:GT2 family glycosyltransferase